MATKKSVKTVKKPVKKSPVKSAKTTTTKVETKAAVSSKRSSFLKPLEDKNVPYIVVAEIIGSFMLTLVATTALQLGDLSALFVGLTLAVLVLTIGAVSGAHVNPAVTFGLWSVGKLKTALVPAYWLAQFAGAMLAILLVSVVSGSKLNVNLAHFSEFDWSIAAIEFVAAAVFLFGIVAVVNRKGLSDTSKAFGVGLSLMIAILIGTTFSGAVIDKATADYSTKAQAAQQLEGAKMPEIPRELFVSGVTVNPAVALAVNEKTESDYQQGQGDDTKFSRLGLEVIVGTLLGAALGANLARLTGRNS